MVNTRSRSGVYQPAVPCQETSNNTNPDPQQSQQHQAPPPPPPPARDRHREFMSHKPPSFSHSPDPLQADDWVKTVEKMLNIVQFTNRENVLYASGRLEGTTVD
jgi:hypothetical protein